MSSNFCPRLIFKFGDLITICTSSRYRHHEPAHHRVFEFSIARAECERSDRTCEPERAAPPWKLVSRTGASSTFAAKVWEKP